LDRCNFNLFDTTKLFDPEYAEKFSKNQVISEDLVTLRNAIELIAALKKERLHREVYLLRDSIHKFKSQYPFLTGSYLKSHSKFIVPDVGAPQFKKFHSGQQFH